MSKPTEWCPSIGFITPVSTPTEITDAVNVLGTMFRMDSIGPEWYFAGLKQIAINCGWEVPNE